MPKRFHIRTVLKGRTCHLGLATLLALIVVPVASLRGDEPPRQLYLDFQLRGIDAQQNPQPLPLEPTYIQRATWYETMRASLQATYEAVAETSDVPADEQEFRPAFVRLTAEGAPRHLVFPVAGNERLHFAALGRYPDHGSATFLRPRLINADGEVTELDLSQSSDAEAVQVGRAAATEMDVEGETWKGFSLQLGEISFPLESPYTRFEVDVVYQPETALPPYAAIDKQPISERADQYNRVHEALWDRLARDFRDRQSQIEMEMERQDGIWNEYAPVLPGDLMDYYRSKTDARRALAQRTLELVERATRQPKRADDPASAAFDAALVQILSDEQQPANEQDARKFFAQMVELRRSILFSHPALQFKRLLVSKRTPPLLSAPGDNYFGINNNTGPGLVVLEDWQADRPREHVLLENQLPPGCAMHADVSFDGQRIVFAYADHTPPRDERQFFLYEIGADGSGLRQLTGTSQDPLHGEGGRMTVMLEDYDPCYLPDGGIAFISTRNQGGVRCHNGDRYCPTYLLYRCDADGSHVRQLSFGEANEWDPTVMPNGQILWTRWDYVNRPVLPTLGLWTIRPDGTAAEHYFGNYTPNPYRICEARPIPGSRKVVATTAGHHTMHAGSLIIIDRQVAADGLDAITRLTPEANFPEAEPTSPVSFASPYPLNEDLYLAAYSPYAYPASMDHMPRADAYGIYVVDSLGGRELIYRDPDISCLEPLPLAPRPMPPALSSQLVNADQATGVFYLQDVYQSTQEIPRGTIRSLRVNQLIPQPTQRVPHSSVVTYDVLKRVLGTVPVDENGSVAFEAPAGVPLQFQALDADGQAVMTMRTFTHLQAGEQVGCVGCHDPRNASPLATANLPAAQPVLKLQPPAGPHYEGGMSFARTVQPVLDRYCIECHGLQPEINGVNLLGSFEVTEDNLAAAHWKLLPSTSYTGLTGHESLVKVAQYGGESWYSEPYDYFAHGGTLAKLLRDRHEGVELDAASLQRVIDWLDLNAPLYGTYSWNKDEWRQADPAGEKALRAVVRQRFGTAWASQPFAALVNVALPDESRILLAPLPVAAGGWGQVPASSGGWKNDRDPAYQKMRKLIQAAIQPLPYHDIAGTCGRDENCRCLSCWVRRIQEQKRIHTTAAQ
jgi:hypothetical protein